MTRLSITTLCWLMLVRGSGIADEKPIPKHLVDAQDLVQHLELKHTSYDLGETRVTWTGARASHADFSGFIDALLTHSYGYTGEDFKRWFDSHRPSARRYHDAITARRGFTAITLVRDVRPGDFLAVKYLNRKDHTGHIMLAAAAPHRMKSKNPIVEGTEQWEVKIIDSSESGHGSGDTRHGKGESGKDHKGLGQGILRIYSDKHGRVAGFTWSTLDSSQFKDPKDEHLVIGRLQPGFQP